MWHEKFLGKVSRQHEDDSAEDCRQMPWSQKNAYDPTWNAYGKIDASYDIMQNFGVFNVSNENENSDNEFFYLGEKNFLLQNSYSHQLLRNWEQ